MLITTSLLLFATVALKTVFADSSDTNEGGLELISKVFSEEVNSLVIKQGAANFLATEYGKINEYYNKEEGVKKTNKEHLKGFFTLFAYVEKSLDFERIKTGLSKMNVSTAITDEFIAMENFYKSKFFGGEDDIFSKIKAESSYGVNKNVLSAFSLLATYRQYYFGRQIENLKKVDWLKEKKMKPIIPLFETWKASIEEERKSFMALESAQVDDFGSYIGLYNNLSENLRKQQEAVTSLAEFLQAFLRKKGLELISKVFSEEANSLMVKQGAANFLVKEYGKINKYYNKEEGVEKTNKEHLKGFFTLFAYAEKSLDFERIKTGLFDVNLSTAITDEFIAMENFYKSKFFGGEDNIFKKIEKESHYGINKNVLSAFLLLATYRQHYFGRQIENLKKIDWLKEEKMKPIISLFETWKPSVEEERKTFMALDSAKEDDFSSYIGLHTELKNNFGKQEKTVRSIAKLLHTLASSM